MKRLMIVLCFIFMLNLSATIINIPADQPTIQAGINIAAEGDTVLVASGIYYENLIWPLITGIKLIGSGANDCIIDGNSLSRVIRIYDIIGSPTVIEGFTIQNGYANGNTYPDYRGGGIFCRGTSLQLANLDIMGNSASEEGGGIYSENSDLSLFNVSILNNVSYLGEWNTGGGGIHCRFSTVDMENVNFHLNTAAGSGGGLYCNSTILNIINSEFYNNHSLYYANPEYNQFGGGGMFCYGGGSSYLENVTFLNNDAISNGGGIGLNISDAIMKNVYFTNNSALMRGGGVYLNQSDSELINLLVANNISGLSGGGLSVNAAFANPIFLTNVSIVDNISTLGGGICTKLGGPRLTNCILWNNEPEEIYGIDHFNGPPEITIEYSDIQNGEPGIVLENGTVNWLEGNIDEDPLFLGLGEHPYSLFADSPCIDAGTPDTTGLNLPEYDLSGNSRIFGNRIDMGAYEWDGTSVDEDELVVMNWNIFNYPNPFNPTTTISFEIKENSTGILKIFNIKGQIIELHQFESGEHNYLWDASKQASGVYLYKLNVNGKTKAVKKCLLLK